MDAAPEYALSSVDAFTEAAAQAAELGFTDIVVRWPRATVADRKQESVLEQVAADVMPALRHASGTGDRPGADIDQVTWQGSRR